MRRKTKIFVVVLLMAMLISVCQTNRTQAKIKFKNRVTYTLNNGTLTVKGKGAMPKKMLFKGNKKIKKVVIKNGITIVPKRAFKNCKNLKTVIIGNSVKTIDKEAFENCNRLKNVKIGINVNKIGKYSFANTGITKIAIPRKVKVIGVGAFFETKLLTVTMPGKIRVPYIAQSEIPEFLPHVKTVKFNTNLSVHTVNYANADNLIVRKGDKYYKSIDGIIYTKDGKKTVRLPDRQVINIAEGCTEFTMKSLLYAEYLGDGVYLDRGRNIRKIIIPKTVSKITMGSNMNELNCNFTDMSRFNLDSVIVQNKQMNKEKIKVFTDLFSEVFNIEYTEFENADNVIKMKKK